MLLSIDLHSPVSLSLVSREQVCGSQLACPLVKGQKASLLRKDVAVEVPFYVPEVERRMIVYNNDLPGIIAAVVI